jgi:hypothetical protein
MATFKQSKNDTVYRGINLYESELQIIINSLQKAKLDGSKEIIKLLARTIDEAREE